VTSPVAAIPIPIPIPIPVPVPAPVAAVPAPEAAAAAPAEAAQAALLAGLYQQIEQLPDSPERAKLIETLKALETKTDTDDESGVEQMIKTVADLAPDVAEIAINTLINPASGLTTLVQKVAMRVASSKKK
jgi:hypothetical protein